jgi:hypothetical protein
VLAPLIKITFYLEDKMLAENLFAELELKSSKIHQLGTYVDLVIYSREDFLKVINLINGYMRKKKIVELHRSIEWFNKYAKSSSPIPLLGKYSSPIN